MSHDVPATAGQHAQRSALIAHRESHILHACLNTMGAVTQLPWHIVCTHEGCSLVLKIGQVLTAKKSGGTVVHKATLLETHIFIS